jgi:hypothetical protein
MLTTNVPEHGTEGRDLLAAVLSLTERVGQLEGLLVALREAADRKIDRSRLFDVKALAKRWRCSERTVQNVVSEGQIVPTYILSNLRFTLAAVEACERSHSGLSHGRRAPRKGGRPRASERKALAPAPVGAADRAEP